MILIIKIISLTILVTGVFIASVLDYRTLTINNRLTFSMFISGIILSSIFYLNSNIKSLIVYYISVAIVFIFVYLLWHAGLWAGGDVKLFTAISTLFCADYLDIIPRHQFYGYILPYYGSTFFIPTFSLIANSVFSIIPLITSIITYEIIKNKPHLMKDLFKKYDLINLLSTLNSFGIIFLINHTIHVYNIILNLLLLVFISYTLNRLLKKHEYATYILTIICLLANIVLDNIQIYIFEAILLLLAVIVKNIIKYDLLKEVLSTDVKISELEESMILTYSLNKNEDEYFFDKRGLKEKLLDNSNYETVINQKAHGLTKEDIKLLKKLYENKVISDSVKIKRSVAFAPFILCGLIITLTIGNTYLIIKDIIGVIL